MDRLDRLEMELEKANNRMLRATDSERIKIRKEIDRILSEMKTYDDNWVPETTDVDVNEL